MQMFGITHAREWEVYVCVKCVPIILYIVGYIEIVEPMEFRTNHNLCILVGLPEEANQSIIFVLPLFIEFFPQILNIADLRLY